MNRRELSTTGHGHQVKGSAEQSNVIQLNKKIRNNKKPEHKEAKNHRNVSSAHLHYMSKPTALKLVTY